MADVIVLDSSPDNSSSLMPPNIEKSPGELFGLPKMPSSPSSPVSPSALRPPSRSRFFPVEQAPKDEKPNEKATAGKKRGIPAKKKTDEDVAADKPKRGRKRLVDELRTVLGDVQSKESAPKKATVTRKKRTDTANKREEPKNKTIMGRVSKSRSDAQTKEPKKGGEVSPQPTTKEPEEWEKDGLQLEEATKRRLDWTPTKDTSKQMFKLDGESDAGSPKAGRNLLSEFGFSGTTAPRDTTAIDKGCPTKRRRIELVDSEIYPTTRFNKSDPNRKFPEENDKQPAAPPEKKAKQTKKFTSLTARVTSRYIPDDHGLDSGQDISREGSITQDTDNPKSKRKNKAKAKPQEPDFMILSPEAAAKSVEEQDLIFGTCSQLEREDSPTMLRDMQTAIKASESCIVPERNSVRESNSMASRFSKSKNLWSVAARDIGGSLFETEVLDMVDTDISQVPTGNDAQPQRRQEKHEDPIEMPDVQSEPSQNELPKPRDELPVAKSFETEALAKDKPQAALQTNKIPHPMPHYGGFTDAELSKQVIAYGFKSIRGRKKMIDLLQKCWESKHGKSAESDNQPTTNETTKPAPQPETAEKEQKTKSTQPTKPKSQTGKATDSTKTESTKNTSTSVPQSQPTFRLTGNPKPIPKPTTKQESNRTPTAFSFRDIEEIQDSEDEFLPSPSSLQSRYLNTETKPLPTIPNPSTPTRPKLDSAIHSKQSIPNPDLSSQITKAVRMQPNLSSTGGRNRPSWHEKILMYDPIILEDFTIWLNTAGLGLVGEDREVSPAFVREWCEGKGICCCFQDKKRR